MSSILLIGFTRYTLTTNITTTTTTPSIRPQSSTSSSVTTTSRDETFSIPKQSDLEDMNECQRLYEELENSRKQPRIIFKKTKQHGAKFRGCYVESKDESKRYKGIINTINRTYFPVSYKSTKTTAVHESATQEYKASTQEEQHQLATAATTPASVIATIDDLKRESSIKAKATVIHGAVLGKKIDQELLKCTEYMNTRKISLHQFRESLKNDSTCLQMFKSLQQRTLLQLKSLEDLGLQPVACQVPVSCVSSRYATEIDMLCIEIKTRKWVIIECKSGFETSLYHSGTANMAEPYTAFLDCEYHRHQLQLAVTLGLFSLTFPHLSSKEIDGYILHVNSVGSMLHRLEPWVSIGQARLTQQFGTRKKRNRQPESTPSTALSVVSPTTAANTTVTNNSNSSTSIRPTASTTTMIPPTMPDIRSSTTIGSLTSREQQPRHRKRKTVQKTKEATEVKEKPAKKKKKPKKKSRGSFTISV